jgi:uncharacterized protein
LWYALTRKPKCRACQVEMVMLDEAADDQHLDAGQQREERLGSVNYQVWACPSCDDVKRVRRGRWFSGYSRCPKCSYQTKSKVSKTIQVATTLQGGRVQVDEHCDHCSYHNTYTYGTPRLAQHTSSHRSGLGGFSSGGGRSSRGSGFGGGRSSGRGASGRW